MATIFYTLALLLLVSSLLNSARAAGPFKAIYAFGDSYTDTGSTNSTTGPSVFSFVSNPPYGSTFFHHPTNRYSDGRLVIDFVAQSLSLPFLSPYIHGGSNYAVAGSTAIDESFFVKNNITEYITSNSLRSQIAYFKRFLAGKGCQTASATPRACSAVFRHALVWVGEIGANDYGYGFFGLSVPPKTIQEFAVNSTIVFLQALLRRGAKYVVVQGLPPTGCLTLSMVGKWKSKDSMGCAARANEQSEAHNKDLKAELDVVRKQFPKSTLVYADYYNAYAEVVKNPRKYGFTELYKACCGYGGGDYNFNYFNACGSKLATSCGDPWRYINWDGIHLTEAMYKALANAFVNGSYSQPPFSSLLRRKRRERLE